ncbi:transglycosylase domain-containing protein [Actinoallomurus liliacearum]|uniref:Transglycosylase domain-containing protein n=1 Tax=Actinoallomurus liliacearum TaxID=1080073 RepID=A0ABP8TW68_9ACTN
MSICMIGVAYAMVKVPKINADVQEQGTTIYWGGSAKNPQVLGRIGASRQILPDLSKVSKPMQAAALAAEDRKFYHEAAISPTGIARAVYNNVSGGDTQGGSTITQQYVKNAYLSPNRTFTRKFKEIFIAVKVNKQVSKDQILLNYLNTIYFGAPTKDMTGAYSVETAAQIWFGHSASQLTVPEAAILASNIKQPGYYTPASKGQQRTDTMERYNWVLQGMRTMGNISDADLAKYQNHLPKVKKTASSAYRGQNGYLLQRITNVLRNSMGFTDTDLNTKGLKIYTTWRKDLQDKAVAAVEPKLKGLPSDTRAGLVTIDPNTGEVLAAYGGHDYSKRQQDDAFYSTVQVGSSFKPYVLATAIKNGIGLKSMFDARAPQYFTTDGESVPKGTSGAMTVVNDEGNTNEVVDLIKATQMSYNTVYVPLGFKAGSQDVFDLAEKAGLPADSMKHQLNQGGFFLGQADMSPLAQAGGYATIANDGEYIRPHIIRKVLDSKGAPYKPEKWQHYVTKHEAFSKDVARDTQYAMQSVVKYPGTGYRAALPGREVAGKTGTTSKNMAAWFVGFTPKQYVTSVAMWRYRDKQHKFLPLQNIGGLSHVNGGDFPARIWHDFMSSALENKPVTHFEGPVYKGDTQRFATPSPTATTPTPTMTPTCRPDQDPAVDDCKPRKTPNPNDTKHCDRFPTPDCPNHSQSPGPGTTCKPWDVNCTSPSTDPGGPPGKHGNTAQDVQGQAARPLKD